MAFADVLRALPPVDHLERIELVRDGEPAGVIENRPGQTGSLAVYHHLIQTYGEIGTAAARHGLELYAEHTEDARRNPGRHPNIDRLLRLVAEDGRLQARLVPRPGAEPAG